MKIDITTDLADHNQHSLSFTITCTSDSAENVLVLPAMTLGNGITVSDLKIADPLGNEVQYRIDGGTLSIPAPCFQLSYVIQTKYTQCVGSDLEVDFLYPFANAHELFFGSGCIAYPAELSTLADTIQASFHLSGVPEAWRVFSNLLSEQISPAALDSFFVYCAPDIDIHRHSYAGLDGPVIFQLCVQRGKSIPVTPAEIWRYLDDCCTWLEGNLGSLSHLRQINILVLQAPADFAEIASGRTFATGENMLNGIAVYAPDDLVYLQRIFRHSSYKYFLYDGLMHELMHFFTTSAWQGKYKSILYPSVDCPPAHARLLGESLNVYFHDAFVRRWFTGSDEAFLEDTLAHALHKQQQNQQPHPLVSLFVLDAWLHSRGTSLLTVFRKLADIQRKNPGPYRSVDFLFTVIEEAAGLTPPPEIREMIRGEGTGLTDPDGVLQKAAKLHPAQEEETSAGCG